MYCAITSSYECKLISQKSFEVKSISQIFATSSTLLTGVSFNENELGVMAYNSDSDTYFSYFTEKAALSFPGTGDVFSSACVGALMRGLTLEKALVVAVNFTLEAIKASIRDPQRRWYSVNFEEALPFLIDELKKNT